MSRIFLLLSDPVAAARTRSLIDHTPGLQTVGWVSTLDHARVQIPAAQPDLVIADLQLADGPFAGLLDALCHTPRYGRPKTLVLTVSPDHPHLFAALRHGADSFLVTGRPAESLIEAVRQVLRGEAAIAPGVARRMEPYFAPRAGEHDVVGEAMNPLALSGVERRVLEAIAEAYAEEDIQRALCLTAADLGRHVRAIYRKLQFDQQAGAFSLKAA